MTEVRYVRSPAALSRVVGSDVLLAATDHSEVDRLSLTAGAVWKLLRDRHTLSSLLRALSKAYGVPRDQIAGDVLELLDDLVQRGWVEEVGDPEA